MDKYAKAFVGAVMAGVGAVGTALGDGLVTGQEWCVAVGAALASLVIVWGVPNEVAK